MDVTLIKETNVLHIGRRVSISDPRLSTTPFQHEAAENSREIFVSCQCLQNPNKVYEANKPCIFTSIILTLGISSGYTIGPKNLGNFT